jgi:hypothetical protein
MQRIENNKRAIDANLWGIILLVSIILITTKFEYRYVHRYDAQIRVEVQ